MSKLASEQMFQDSSRFDPSQDGKIPLKRTPFALGIRLVLLLSQMLLSKHPKDAVIWLNSLYYRHRPLSYIVPWITFDAARELEKRLHADTKIFEYGAGHSTVYWAAKGLSITSVEDNHDWFQVVRDALKDKANAQVFFKEDPNDYVNSIQLSNTEFDVVIIDGSHRKECIKVASKKLKPGGVLIVDNTDWHWFKNKTNLVPDTWEKYVFPGPAPFIGHLSETTLWLKPVGLAK